MSKQRFVVVSTDGWRIIEGGSRSGSSHRPGRTASVLDSLAAFRGVAHFRSEERKGQHGYRLGVEGATQKAQLLAAQLNAEEAA